MPTAAAAGSPIPNSTGGGSFASSVVTVRAPHPLWQFLLLANFIVRGTLARSDFLLAWIAIFVSFFACVMLSSRQSSDQNGMQNKRGIIFFLFSLIIHVNAIFVENEVRDRNLFFALRARRYFSTGIFFCVTFLRLAVPRVLFSLVALLFTRFVFESAAPLVVLLGLTSFTHSVLVLLLVFFVPNARRVTIILLVYYAYSVIFSGFLITSTAVPGIITQMSLLRPGYGTCVSVELRSRPFSCDAAVNSNTTSYCYSGDQYLAMQGFAHDSFAGDSVQLLITALVLLAGVLLKMYFSRT